MDLNTILFAAFGGIVPALLWLWFWLREDKKNPEPTYAIVKAFVAGMLSVPIALVLEKAIAWQLAAVASGTVFVIIKVTLWSFIEEGLKLGFAHISSLKQKYNDEPVDALIYMITVALGFAALENTLFLLDPLAKQEFLNSIFTGNFRFLGATLLHVLSSSIIGAALALGFHLKKKAKLKVLAVAFLLATVVHALFNFSLTEFDMPMLQIFATVWVAMVMLLALFEKVKRIKY